MGGGVGIKNDGLIAGAADATRRNELMLSHLDPSIA